MLDASPTDQPDDSQPGEDPPESPEQGRWRRLPRPLKAVIVAVCSIVVLLALTKLIVQLRDRSDPVDTAAVVKQFEEDGASADGDGGTTIASGAFVYNAKGTEFVDLLGGPMHEFPPEVVATTTSNDCGGSTNVLKLFEQRNDEMVLCPTDDGAMSMKSSVTRHEFAGLKDQTTTACPENNLWPAGLFELSAGLKARAECIATGDSVGTIPAMLTSRVFGQEEVIVDGDPVDAQHLQISTVIGSKGSETYGTYDNDFWVTEEGVVVRRTLDANVSAKTPAGQVGFKESYDLFLQELPA